MKNRLSLDVLRISEPCQAPWDSMAGDERARHCEQCNLSVHDLSALTTAEAHDLLDKTPGRLCIRFSYTPDGAIITRAPAPARWWSTLRTLLMPVIGMVATSCSPSGTVQGKRVPDPGVVTVGGARMMTGTPAPIDPAPTTAPGSSSNDVDTRVK